VNKQPSSTRQISISPSIVYWTILILLGAWFVYVIRDVIILFFIALILSAAIEPAVRKMKKRNVPRSVSVLIIYLVLLLILGGLLSYIVPVVVTQTNEFIRQLPLYAEKLTGSPLFFEELSKNTLFGGEVSDRASFAQNIFSTTIGVFYGFISFLAVLAIAFYMSIVEDGVGTFLRSITPSRYQEYVVSRAKIIYNKIGNWMIGQLFLMLIIFVLYYIVLTLLGVPNALVLALLGGLLEIIPYVGPIAAGIPAVILGFFVSPWVSVLVLVSYILIQQAENHILIPQIMKRFVGLNPIVVILALLIGGQVAGVVGIILAVPVATALGVFIKDALEKRQEHS